PAVFGADLILVIALSVVTGVGYHWIFLNRLPDFWPYVAIGALAFTNFSAVLAARGDYRVSNLINFRRQARDVTLVWGGVLLLLLGLAFSLKVTEGYSRGSTMAFFALGLLTLLAWRGVLARILTK